MGSTIHSFNESSLTPTLSQNLAEIKGSRVVNAALPEIKSTKIKRFVFGACEIKVEYESGEIRIIPINIKDSSPELQRLTDLVHSLIIGSTASDTTPSLDSASVTSPALSDVSSIRPSTMSESTESTEAKKALIKLRCKFLFSKLVSKGKEKRLRDSFIKTYNQKKAGDKVIASLEARIEKLTKQNELAIEELEDQLVTAKKRLKSTHTDLQSSTAHGAQLKHYLNTSRAQCESIKGQLAELTEQIATLTSDKDNLQGKSHKLDAAFVNLQAQLSESKTTIEQQSASLRERDATIEEQSATIQEIYLRTEELEANLQSRDKLLQGLEAQKVELQEALASASGESVQNAIANQSLLRGVITQSATIVTLKEKLVAAEQSLIEARNAISTSQHNLTLLSADRNIQIAHSNEIDTKLSQLRQELNLQGTAFSERERDLLTQKDDNEARITLLTADLDKTKTLLDHFRRKVTSHETQIASQLEKLESLHKDVVSLHSRGKEDVRSLKEEVSLRRKEIYQKDSKIAALESDLVALRDNADSSLEQISQLETQIAKEKAYAEVLSAKKDDLTARLSENTGLLNTLTSQLEKKTSHYETLLQKFTALQDVMTHQSAAFKKKQATLSTKISDLEGRLLNAHEELAEEAAAHFLLRDQLTSAEKTTPDKISQSISSDVLAFLSNPLLAAGSLGSNPQHAVLAQQALSANPAQRAANSPPIPPVSARHQPSGTPLLKSSGTLVKDAASTGQAYDIQVHSQGLLSGAPSYTGAARAPTIDGEDVLAVLLPPHPTDGR